jgi:hypothetical protein
LQVKEVMIKYRRSDKFSIYTLGDIHLGTIHCAEHQLKNKINEIKKDPMAYWVGMGDYGDYITPKDKRWSSGDIAPWVKQDDIGESVRERLRELFEPIKDKCIGLLYGNHEVSYSKQNDGKVHEHICKDLKLDNLGYSCFIHFIFKRIGSTESHLIKGFFTHGNGGARTPGAKLNYLRDVMSSFDANIYGYAHVHDIKVHSPDVLKSTDSLEISAKSKIGALTGCWFRTYTQGKVASYGEVKVYPPSRIGCPKFIICPNQGSISVEIPAIEW